MRRLWLGLVLFCLAGIGGAFAQSTGPELTALARLTEAPVLQDTRRGATLELSLTQPVPWRVFTLDGPPRLVLDFSELDFAGADGAVMAAGSERVVTVGHGLWRPGWTRMVLELAAPMKVTAAGMQTAGAGAATLSIDLTTTGAEDFAASAGAPPSAVFADEAGRDLCPPPRRRQTGEEPSGGGAGPGPWWHRPGGGGRRGGRGRPGPDLCAWNCASCFLRTGGFEVVLTREDDRFVPLGDPGDHCPPRRRRCVPVAARRCAGAGAGHRGDGLHAVRGCLGHCLAETGRAP